MCVVLLMGMLVDPSPGRYTVFAAVRAGSVGIVFIVKDNVELSFWMLANVELNSFDAQIVFPGGELPC